MRYVRLKQDALIVCALDVEEVTDDSFHGLLVTVFRCVTKPGALMNGISHFGISAVD